MAEYFYSPEVIRFGVFEVELRSGEVRKSGVKLKLGGQPFQVLAILLEKPGEVVTREELQKRLWPDTFVDVDHNLNTAINKIREVLGDSPESPRFVETLPRRGYRFIAPVNGASSEAKQPAGEAGSRSRRRQIAWIAAVFAALMLVAGAGWTFYEHTIHAPVLPRTLTRITFDAGLQIGATWSPDGRFIAYSSDRGGKFDLWVQPIGGGDAIQITKGAGNHWQPDWSPDGRYIAYRGEDGGGGLYIVPALGGAGQERKISSFGYYPRWSPDGSQILFQRDRPHLPSRFYVVDANGSDPREVLGEISGKIYGISAAWHPDGKRITVRSWELVQSPIPTFWTAPVAGGAAVRSEISPETMKMAEKASGSGYINWADSDFSFSWAPSGRGIYLERTFQGARNLWLLSVEPVTLRVTGIERLTTGADYDTELAVARDGKKIAFMGGTRHVRTWVFPFDAKKGQVTGEGHGFSPEGVESWSPSVSRDGKLLAFCGRRSARWNLEVIGLPSGNEVMMLADDYARMKPNWSPDNKTLAYVRYDAATGTERVMTWSSEDQKETPITDVSPISQFVYDWSPDGKQLLVTLENKETHRGELWTVPIDRAPHAQVAGRELASDSSYDLFQGHFSPDGHWIAFEAIRDSPFLTSQIYVMPATGGPWTPMAKSERWDDKPRWSPDGKTLYYISDRGGFYNVWGIRFDANKGLPIGEAFQVTALNSPSLMIADTIPPVDLSLTQDQLVVTVEQISGSIWQLDQGKP